LILKTNKATQEAAAQFILQPQYTDTSQCGGHYKCTSKLQ